MAEWIGPRRRRRSRAEAEAPPVSQEPPEAPGAVSSPQQPGEVPDRSTIAGKFSTSVPPATTRQRPLTEYETAQRIIGVFAAAPGEEREPSRFEQVTASFEEMRKVDPGMRPPVRPAPGYDLDVEQSPALPASTDASASDTGF